MNLLSNVTQIIHWDNTCAAVANKESHTKNFVSVSHRPQVMVGQILMIILSSLLAYSYGKKVDVWTLMFISEELTIFRALKIHSS